MKIEEESEMSANLTEAREKLIIEQELNKRLMMTYRESMQKIKYCRLRMKI